MLNRPFTYLSLNTPCVALGCVATVLGAKASKGTCRAKRGGKPLRALAECARKKVQAERSVYGRPDFVQVSERRAANGSENSLCTKCTPSYRNAEETGESSPVVLPLDINRANDRCLIHRKVVLLRQDLCVGVRVFANCAKF